MRTIDAVDTVSFDGTEVTMLDQTRLPGERVRLTIQDTAQMHEAIRTLRVRGAPAIGVAAAFGLWLGVRALPDDTPRAEAETQLRREQAYLAGARPTAVNLTWALERCAAEALQTPGSTADLKRAALEAAIRLRSDEEATTRRIGEHGAALLAGLQGVLTHCNAGSAATVGLGTALAPIYVAAERGHVLHVFADETRPLLQGARITAWELQEAGVPVTVITDSMAAVVMRQGKVGAVIVGCDRVAANGDVANKIGTYGVALLARAHGLPFYVAGPTSTIDLATPDGDHIEIEQRAAQEVTHHGGVAMAPAGVDVFNPAFDVTPAELVTALITERGVIYPPYTQGLRDVKA
ncbi:methylthioribose-1-phosphate isomerase [Deinococcus metalli]|uniref:Methylthioribose-1-phosphate isomerase n=1 Tax=Deinococcus metalli TaxID=1141878 RepID=A0A7W8NQL7_9DEIO|nr:S-methyl-5-thioribose-1-phosphate isomerase [Deinococcus metalli]MBB5378021.1 methylthioribose-1-phosphate isomerase [Deinococcus metalli]GHF53827.1 methylthioribose-1-phosphate isomerase [Deinococcus metalli]